jgi:hypothetical protein
VEGTMIVAYLLFETRLGEWLLSQLERRLGLGVVRANELPERNVLDADFARVIYTV